MNIKIYKNCMANRYIIMILSSVGGLAVPFCGGSPPILCRFWNCKGA